MLRALMLSRGRTGQAGFPPIVERWTGLSVDRGHLHYLTSVTGLRDPRALSILYPHVVGFRLHMQLLTHPEYPLPIWGALQIRNRLIQHEVLEAGAVIDLETRVGSQRVGEKGLEVDLLSRATRGGRLCWESEITYYYRGRFEGAVAGAPRAASPDLAGGAEVDRFRMPRAGGWRFAGMSGDYNGLHLWTPYARLLGFQAAFPHSQRVAAMCLSRLEGPTSNEQTLELWIKGPVFYRAKTVLSRARLDDGLAFSLALADERRAALVGRWRSAS
ncbi:MAG TPA: hypothetical protein VGE08_09470 [Steroidobacter sp.]|uniref:hypothetical protein n=1 Tax=Steroidobacter sp. TaxID=1978227 RepID=UPI002ED83109